MSIIESMLPQGVSMETVIIIMASLSALTVFLMIYVTLLAGDDGIKRARAIGAQRDGMRAGAIGPVRRKKRLQTIGMMQKTVENMKLLKSSQAEKVALKLMKAGWRSKDAMVRYFFFKLVLPFAFGIIAVTLLYGLKLYQMEDSTRAMVAIGSVALGAYLPDILIKNAAQKRQDAIRKTIPDALDLMVICSEAGLSLDATLMRVAEEMERGAPEISDELTVTGLELGFLPDRRKALQNLAARTDLPILRGLVNTLLQAERYGTPLANSLRVMARESRDQRMMRAEEKAARLPALMTVPMIIFILPPLFVVLLGPAGLDIADFFGRM